MKPAVLDTDSAGHVSLPSSLSGKMQTHVDNIFPALISLLSLGELLLDLGSDE
jgi:hypothetical protein